MQAVEWPPARHLADGSPSMSTNPFAEYHRIYAVVLVALAAASVGTPCGVGRLCAQLPLVRDPPGSADTRRNARHDVMGDPALYTVDAAVAQAHGDLVVGRYDNQWAVARAAGPHRVVAARPAGWADRTPAGTCGPSRRPSHRGTLRTDATTGLAPIRARRSSPWCVVSSPVWTAPPRAWRPPRGPGRPVGVACPCGYSRLGMAAVRLRTACRAGRHASLGRCCPQGCGRRHTRAGPAGGDHLRGDRRAHGCGPRGRGRPR